MFYMQKYDKDVLVDGMNTMPGKGGRRAMACMVMCTIMVVVFLEMMTVTMRTLTAKS